MLLQYTRANRHPAVVPHPQAYERAVAELQYGSVNVNTITGLGFFMPKLTWGAYPGSSARDIQSGSGNVHNGLLFKHVQKSVLRGGWAWPYTPFYVNDNHNGQALSLCVADYFAYPTVLNFVRCFLNALVG